MTVRVLCCRFSLNEHGVVGCCICTWHCQLRNHHVLSLLQDVCHQSALKGTIVIGSTTLME